MQAIEALELPDDRREALLRAAERYQAAVRARRDALCRADPVALAGTSEEVRLAVRRLFELGLTPGQIQALYDEVMAE